MVFPGGETILNMQSFTILLCSEYVYPDGIQALGWMIELFPVVLPVAVGLYTSVKHILDKDAGGAAFLR